VGALRGTTTASTCRKRHRGNLPKGAVRQTEKITSTDEKGREPVGDWGQCSSTEKRTGQLLSKRGGNGGRKQKRKEDGSRDEKRKEKDSKPDEGWKSIKGGPRAYSKEPKITPRENKRPQNRSRERRHKSASATLHYETFDAQRKAAQKGKRRGYLLRWVEIKNTKVKDGISLVACRKK